MTKFYPAEELFWKDEEGRVVRGEIEGAGTCWLVHRPTGEILADVRFDPREKFWMGTIFSETTKWYINRPAARVGMEKMMTEPSLLPGKGLLPAQEMNYKRGD